MPGLAKTLQDARERSGLTRKRLAELIGVHPMTITNAEGTTRNGKRVTKARIPRRNLLDGYAQFTELDRASLYNLAGYPPPIDERDAWSIILERANELEAAYAADGEHYSKPDPLYAGKRTRGRPRGRNDPRIDWNAIEAIYVQGEDGGKDEHGIPKPRHFPSLRELAGRVGCSPALLYRRARDQGWSSRQALFQSTYKVEFAKASATAAARSTASDLRVIDDWLGLFEEQLKEGRVRADAIADLNTALRLKAFLHGEADTRQEVRHGLTLDAMQERHRVAREAQATSRDDAAAGVLGHELPPASPLGVEDGARVQAVEVEGTELAEAPEDRGERVQPAAREADESLGEEAEHGEEAPFLARVFDVA